MNLKQLKSRKIKDSRDIKETKLWQGIQNHAERILYNAKIEPDWYAKSYANYRWYSIYEDGIPVTVEVYSNNNNKWRFEVYLANELEEMMLNVMQYLNGYLIFNGEDVVDEGKTPNAITFDEFFEFFQDNIWNL